MLCRTCFSPFLLILVLLASLAFAGDAPTKNDAKEFVNNISHNVLKIIQSKKDENQKMNILSDIFREVIDTDWIAKFVLGINYRTLDDKQVKIFAKNYENFLVNRYVPKFKQYNRDEIKILSIDQIDEKRFKVSTIIDRQTQEDVTVNYMIKYHPEIGKFRIFDIIAEEVSMIATHRTEFSSLISHKGFDETIEYLQDKIKKH